MLQVLVMESTRKLNFFPPKGGISPYYSPRMILHEENVDYMKHCRVPFGTYVQAHDEPNPTNTQKPRTLDCIYLRPLSNHQGGAELLDLRTNQLITRREFTPVPITQNIIDLVHGIAEREKMPTGLKIVTRTGQVIYDSAWIAGVHYELQVRNNDQNNNNQDDEDDSDDSDYQDSQQSDEDDYGDDDDADGDSGYDEIDPEEVAGLQAPNAGEQEDDEENEEEANPIEADEENNQQEQDDNIETQEDSEIEQEPSVHTQKMFRSVQSVYPRIRGSTVLQG